MPSPRSPRRRWPRPAVVRAQARARPRRASSAASGSAAAPSSSSAPVSTAAGSGGQGAQSVTDYLSYVGGKSGAANSSLAPVTIGYVNEQGDANPPGPLASDGAQMAVNYINKELGGVDGHPLKLDTCFTTTEEQGTTCADQFLANKSLPLIATGGVAVGAQSFFNTLQGKIPVIDGVAVTPFDAVAEEHGDPLRRLHPRPRADGHLRHPGAARQDRVGDLPADTRASRPARPAIEAGLKAAGVTVTMAPLPGQRHQPDLGARGGARLDRRHGRPLRRRHRLREPGQGAHPAGHHRREEDRLRAAVPVAARSSRASATSPSGRTRSPARFTATRPTRACRPTRR